MRMKSWGLLAVAVMACCGTTQAQPLQYEFWINGAKANSFNIPAVNGTVTVSLYMVDTGAPLVGYFGANQTLTGNLRTTGLTGYGVKFNNAAGQAARVLNANAITINDRVVNSGDPDFVDQHYGFNNVNTKSATAGGVTVVASRLGFGDIQPPVPPQYVGQVPVEEPNPAAPAGRILLADFVFTGLVDGGSTVISLVDPDPTQGQTALGLFSNPSLNGGLVLDPVGQTANIFGQTLTLTVNAIPEPSSMILGGIALAGMGLKFRRKKAKAEQAVAV